jgi:hypothetical protein
MSINLHQIPTGYRLNDFDELVKEESENENGNEKSGNEESADGSAESKLQQLTVAAQNLEERSKKVWKEINICLSRYERENKREVTKNDLKDDQEVFNAEPKKMRNDLKDRRQQLQNKRGRKNMNKRQFQDQVNLRSVMNENNLLKRQIYDSKNLQSGSYNSPNREQRFRGTQFRRQIQYGNHFDWTQGPDQRQSSVRSCSKRQRTFY